MGKNKRKRNSNINRNEEEIMAIIPVQILARAKIFQIFSKVCLAVVEQEAVSDKIPEEALLGSLKDKMFLQN